MSLWPGNRDVRNRVAGTHFFVMPSAMRKALATMVSVMGTVNDDGNDPPSVTNTFFMP